MIARKWTFTSPLLDATLISSLLVATITLSLTNSLSAELVAGNRQQYKDKRFTIEYPKDWWLQEKQPGVIVAGISPDKDRQGGFNKRVTVGYQSISPEDTFDSYFERNLQALTTQLHSVQLHHVGEATYGENTGRKILLTHYTTKIPITLRIFMVPGPDMVYVLICSHHRDYFEDSRDRFESILASFTMR